MQISDSQANQSASTLSMEALNVHHIFCQSTRSSSHSTPIDRGDRVTRQKLEMNEVLLTSFCDADYLRIYRRKNSSGKCMMYCLKVCDVSSLFSEPSPGIDVRSSINDSGIGHSQGNRLVFVYSTNIFRLIFS